MVLHVHVATVCVCMCGLLERSTCIIRAIQCLNTFYRIPPFLKSQKHLGVTKPRIEQETHVQSSTATSHMMSEQKGRNSPILLSEETLSGCFVLNKSS